MSVVPGAVEGKKSPMNLLRKILIPEPKGRNSVLLSNIRLACMVLFVLATVLIAVVGH